ncbi:MAG: OmpA family protein [Gemmatimonadetes bacterium]|nr:OmpA family protein [Gemmatimonadota bacterium]MBK6778313.1 OmpA family protein [Gemmatimonadota bacterium]MBK7349378.1 OmpA family protein [Gemmatimonadota bacterium]MBK7714946.1 OmpA family protein [Gemmatimonadota bacterium]MBK7784008.1 OmpA family protein [Gemmatimonadota bacterium]
MNKAREQPIIIIKKKGHGHGHHGGAWKVAFADFMTAMFAMFLVLWLVNQSSDVKSAIAGYFQDPLGRADEFGSSIMPGEGAQTQSPRPMTAQQVIDLRRDRLRYVAEQIKQEIRETPALAEIADHVEVEITEEGLRIQLLEDSTGVFFESGSAAPKAAGAALLELLGKKLGGMPNAVVIEGHTDARPYHRADGYSNWELSVDRANAARRIMLAGGLNDAQLQQVRGWADRRLRDPEHPQADSNRRVTVTMLLPPVTAADTLGFPTDTLAAGYAPDSTGGAAYAP